MLPSSNLHARRHWISLPGSGILAYKPSQEVTDEGTHPRGEI